MSLVINVNFHCMFYWPLFIQHYIYISYINWSFYFFPYFLANFKLITNSVVLLSNNASTVIPSCMSILSSLIFTITFLNIFPLSRLYVDVFSTTLASIANILLLRPSQGLLDILPHLNFFVHISVLFSSQFCSLFFCFYSF